MPTKQTTNEYVTVVDLPSTFSELYQKALSAGQVVQYFAVVDRHPWYATVLEEGGTHHIFYVPTSRR